MGPDNLLQSPSRRSLLAGGVAAGLGIAAAGCSPPEESNHSGLITIPDPAVTLPDEDLTFRVVDSGDTKANYWNELLATYSDKHSHITTEYDALPWNEIEELVPLAVRNKTLHDLVQLLPGPLLNQAIKAEWILPLDDVMPGFEEWKSQYPENVLFEGLHMHGGKTYTFPATADNRYEICLLYSKRLMDEAGFDPESEPLTWDDYREAARKITTAGNGQAYGIVLEGAQENRLDFWINGLAQMGGGYGSNPANGEFDYASDAWYDAFELLQSLLADGSIFPGSTSLTAPQAWPRVATSSAGMVTAGPWVITTWENESPEFEFGVAAHPRPSAEALPIGYAPGKMSDVMFVYSGTTSPEVAGDLMAYHGSIEAAKAWTQIVGPGSPSPYPEAVEAAKESVSAAGRRSLELAEEQVLMPSSVVRNPDVALADQQMEALTPSLGEIVSGVIDGSITDVRSALQDLSDRSNRQRDDAIEAARAAGAEVSREDWVFPNFTPGENYTQDMYGEL
ncbi:ABC transporter substrate-binding protein [Brachybacterium sacelli]|uniref:Multiple sugar transport system substrate-binding protein n=1 Tax=Brachybacterium sacelli TaxID=173364 RepID=A0ABS4WZK3_9MICO|nr:extracellular solute-binding protein [Brachybacterium sacelli]MBP2381521.1 multiple sugar transport system substrate-binding protein [Brachybacterium sacelli]